MSACCDSDSFVSASRRFCGPSARSFSIGELALASLPPPSSSREHALTCDVEKNVTNGNQRESTHLRLYLCHVEVRQLQQRVGVEPHRLNEAANEQ